MQLLKLVVFFLLFALISCDSHLKKTKSYRNNIPITQEFLASEWMIDSINGIDSFIQEWVYFTPHNKFWRFSYYNKTYIIDSSLETKESKVFEDGELKYLVYSVDSNSLILEEKDKVYHLKRNSENFKRIFNFLEANPKKLLINGVWQIDSADYLPAYIPSYCKNLFPGSRVIFQPQGFMDVFEKDSTDKCYSYNYHIFGNELSLSEYDMIVNLEILLLTKDSFVFKSKWLDYENLKWTDEPWKVKENGYKIYCTKVE